MEQHILEAVKLYSGDRPLGLFADKLPYNLKKLNEVYADIAQLFASAGVPNFERLPNEQTACAKFAALFRDLNGYLEAAKLQGFRWNKSAYTYTDEQTGKKETIQMTFDENAYLILAQRYKELSSAPQTPDGAGGDVPYDLAGYLTEIDTGKIDADYMNSRFDKYIKLLKDGGASADLIRQAKDELHKTFAMLTQEEQKYANVFLRDIERGDVLPQDSKTLRDYITEYQTRAKDDQIHRFAETFGMDENKLRQMMGLGLTEMNINEFGRLDELKSTIDKAKAKAYFETKEGASLIPPKVNMKTDRLLRKFILKGGGEEI